MAVEITDLLSSGSVTEINLGGTDPEHSVVTVGALSAMLAGGQLTEVVFYSDWAHIGVDVNTLIFGTATIDRWLIDPNGHLLPNVTSTYNIGSVTNRLGNIYIATDRSIYFGNTQEVRLFYDEGGAHLSSPSDSLYIHCSFLLLATNGDNRWVIDSSGHFRPMIANTYNVGDPTYRLANAYFGTNFRTYFGDSQQLSLYFSGSHGILATTAGSLYLLAAGANNITFTTNNTNRWSVNGSGYLQPLVTNAYDIGSTSLRLRHAYFGDSCRVYLGNGQDMTMQFDGAVASIYAASILEFITTGVNALRLGTQGVPRWLVTSGGNLTPNDASVYDLGSATYRADTIYCQTLDEVSDELYKEDVQESLGLDFILSLSPKSYKMKLGKDAHRKHGLIAQEVGATLLNMALSEADFGGVRKHIIEEEIDGEVTTREEWGISYSQFIAPIINAIKELDAAIKSKK